MKAIKFANASVTVAKMTDALRDWVATATTTEQELLAGAAGITREYLYQLSAGKRNASASMAGRLEEAAKALRRKSKGRLPELTRADLAAACAECPYAKRCLKREKL